MLVDWDREVGEGKCLDLGGREGLLRRSHVAEASMAGRRQPHKDLREQPIQVE